MKQDELESVQKAFEILKNRNDTLKEGIGEYEVLTKRYGNLIAENIQTIESNIKLLELISEYSKSITELHTTLFEQDTAFAKKINDVMSKQKE